MAGVLGMKPSRNFKIYRTEFPAVFRFDGRLFQERFDVNANEVLWVEIDEPEALPWLLSK